MRRLKVQLKACSTCIYRSDSPLDLAKLEAEISDPHMPGHFNSYRICHHSGEAVCAGFWARHREDFNLGQIAQRLGLVELVEHDAVEDHMVNFEMDRSPVSVGDDVCLDDGREFEVLTIPEQFTPTKVHLGRLKTSVAGVGDYVNVPIMHGGKLLNVSLMRKK